MKRKLLALFLTIVMALSLCNVMAFAGEQEPESFIGSNKIRVAGKLDLFGLDLQVDQAYNATMKVYKGYEGFSSDEEAGIHIATNGVEAVGTIDKWIDVGNVGIKAIREKLDQINPDLITYDWLYNSIIDPVLSNLAKQTITFTYGEKTSVYTIVQDKQSAYQTLTLTADDVDFGEEFATIFGTTAENDIQMVYDENAEEDIVISLAKDSYVRLGNQKRTLKDDLSIDLMDSTGEVALEGALDTLMGDIENTETLPVVNDHKVVLQFAAGTSMTVGKTTVTLHKDIRITVDGLGVEDNLISKLERITIGGSDVGLGDYTGLTSLIPTSAGTIAITAEVEPAEEVLENLDTSSEAFVIRGGEVVFSGTLKNAVSSTNAQSGDTVRLNADYAGNIIMESDISGITSELTLDLNGKTIDGGSNNRKISVGGSRTVNIINSSETPAEIIYAKIGSGISYGALRAGGAHSVLNIGGVGSVGAITVTSAGNAFATGSSSATINVYDGTFTGAIARCSGSNIYIYGGTFDHDPTAYVAEGYEAVNNGDGTWTVGTAKVAQIGETKYDTLAAAVAAANADTSGEAITITLLADLDFSDEAYAGYKWAGATYNPLAVTRSNVTIDLGGYTISNMGNAAIVLGNLLAADGRIENVTIKNGTLRAGQTNNVTNSYVLGIAGVDGALVKNITTSGGINVYSAAKDVVIDSCNVTGTKYYTVCAQVGSDVTIKGTTYTKNTDNTVDSKAMFWVHGAGTESDIATDANPTGAHGASTIVIESGSFTVDFTNDGVFKLGSGLNPVVKGGTFNFDPTSYVAEGYEAVDNNNGTWTVGKVKASEIQQAAEATQGYEATYTASKSVVNAQDETDVLKNEVPVTVNVKIEATTDTATAANAANDVAISKVDVEKVVNKAVEVAETTANTINVKIDVVRDKDVAVTVVNAVPTVTFEVHPVATVFVDEEEVGSVILTNDDLKDDASFEITLPVDDAIVAATADNKIQVTHKSESGDEVFTCDIQGTAGNYFVTFTVTHFSAFELAPVSVVAPGDRADCVCTLELTDGFILNFYVDNLKNEYGIAETDVSKYSVRYTYHDVTKTVALSSVTKGAYGYKIPVAYCAAKELCDQVTIDLLYEGNTFRSTITYSAKQYCDYMISVGDATTVALCQKILQYGAYAQYRFHYNEGNLADSNINSWNYPNVVIDSDYNKAGYQNTGWGGVSGASLSLEARTEINIYFRVYRDMPSASDYHATVNGQAATVTNAGDDTFCVTIKNIMATDLNNVYHVAITSDYAGDEGELTIDFSALTYACWMYEDVYAEQEWGVCRALFEYYQAVQAYLAAH